MRVTVQHACIQQHSEIGVDCNATQAGHIRGGVDVQSRALCRGVLKYIYKGESMYSVYSVEYIVSSVYSVYSVYRGESVYRYGV